MLYAKIQDHRTFGSGEEILKVFTTNWNERHLGHLTKTSFMNICPMYLWRLPFSY